MQKSMPTKNYKEMNNKRKGNSSVPPVHRSSGIMDSESSDFDQKEILKSMVELSKVKAPVDTRHSALSNYLQNYDQTSHDFSEQTSGA